MLLMVFYRPFMGDAEESQVLRRGEPCNYDVIPCSLLQVVNLLGIAAPVFLYYYMKPDMSNSYRA